MAFASVRNYQCTSPPSSTIPSGAWSHCGNTTWDVRAAWWPFVSAFVVRRPYAPPTLVTVAAETALLLENTNWRPGMALSWNGAAMSCPSHMSRFLTESLGLCIAAGSASDYGWQPGCAILDADRLSKNSSLYVATGSRPDFIVETPSGWHGIEARGRGSAGPVGPQRPAAAQRQKLKGMHDWSTEVAKHPQIAARPSWSMCWAWITAAGTSVDHFDPGQPVELGADDERAIWSQMNDIAAALGDVDDPRISRVEALDRSVSIVSRVVQENYGSGRQTWLTVASWSERLTDGELLDWRRSREGASTETLQDLLGERSRTAVGAFMATAITEQPPRENELAPLVETIATEPPASAG